MRKVVRQVLLYLIGGIVAIGLSFGGGYFTGRRVGISVEEHRELVNNLRESERLHGEATRLADERAKIIGELSRERDKLEAANDARSAELDTVRHELGQLSVYLRAREEHITEIERLNIELRENLADAQEAILQYLRR